MYDCLNDDIKRRVARPNNDYIEQAKNGECLEKVPFFKSWFFKRILIAIFTFILAFIIIFFVATSYGGFFEIRPTVGA